MFARRHRRLATWLLAFCLVFAQTAAAAYACTRSLAPLTQAPAPCSAHLAEGAAPVAQPGPGDANACEVHCHDASLPYVAAPDVPALAAIVAWRLPAVPPLVLAAAPIADLEARSASPPLRTLYARLLN